MKRLKERERDLRRGGWSGVTSMDDRRTVESVGAEQSRSRAEKREMAGIIRGAEYLWLRDE